MMMRLLNQKIDHAKQPKFELSEVSARILTLFRELFSPALI